jgi:hypothetical protein
MAQVPKENQILRSEIAFDIILMLSIQVEKYFGHQLEFFLSSQPLSCS